MGKTHQGENGGEHEEMNVVCKCGQLRWEWNCSFLFYGFDIGSVLMFKVGEFRKKRCRMQLIFAVQRLFTYCPIS